MTPEQVKFAQTDQICIAFANGKTIQALYDDGYRDLDGLHDWIFTLGKSAPCRIKPTPTLRPWRPEEAPVGAVVRNIGTKSRYLITDWCCAAPSVVKVSGCDYSFAVMLASYEYSLDHGKTWLPCGVLE